MGRPLCQGPEWGRRRSQRDVLTLHRPLPHTDTFSTPTPSEGPRTTQTFTRDGGTDTTKGPRRSAPLFPHPPPAPSPTDRNLTRRRIYPRTVGGTRVGTFSDGRGSRSQWGWDSGSPTGSPLLDLGPFSWSTRGTPVTGRDWWFTEVPTPVGPIWSGPLAGFGLPTECPNTRLCYYQSSVIVLES